MLSPVLFLMRSIWPQAEQLAEARRPLEEAWEAEHAAAQEEIAALENRQKGKGKKRKPPTRCNKPTAHNPLLKGKRARNNEFL